MSRERITVNAYTFVSRVKPTTPARRRIHHKGDGGPGPPPIRETNIHTKSK